MIQRSLDFYFKQTKASGNVDVKATIEVTPRQRRRTVSVVTKKVPAKMPRNTAIKSLFSSSQRAPMKSNRPPDAIINLDDSNEEVETPPIPSTSAATNSQSTSHSKSSKNPSKAQNNSKITSQSKKSQNSSSRTSRTCITQQSPKYFVSLDSDDEEESSKFKSPAKTQNSNLKPQIPDKSPEKIPLTKNSSPKRYLNFTSCESPGKRQRINEIMSQQLTKETSFEDYTLTTTTSIMESLDVSEIFTRQVNKDMSFSNKTQSIIKEELMLSEDEWDPEEVEKSVESSQSPAVEPQNHQELPAKTYLRILPPETINRKFDSHHNSQKSEDNLEVPKKSDKKLKKIETTENSPLRISDSLRDKSSERFQRSCGDLGTINYPQTPKKRNNNDIIAFFKTTPERSPRNIRLSSQRDRVLQSPSNILGTPLKRSPSSFSPTKMSPTKRNYRPRKIFKESTNFQTVVENLNLARQGSISMNEFNLEEIYTKGEFKFQWGKMDTGAAENYDLRDVVIPMNKHSERLFEMILWVFSEPMNCGYFNEEERDLVFKMMCLTQEKQVLLAIMLKREIRWFRVKKQKYEKHFEGNMEGVLMKLADEGFFDSDWETLDIEIIFNLLQVDELKELCKRMKMSHTVAKPKMISSLKQLLRQKTSHFSTTSPREALKSRLTSVAGPILKLSGKFLSLIHRILALYYPNLDPEDKLSDVFYLFFEVHYGNKTFPSSPIMRFPLFKNRQALNGYVEAKLVWTEVTQIMSDKNKGPSHWDKSREYGTQAFNKLKELIKVMTEESDKSGSDQQQSTSDCQKLPFDTRTRSKLPSHIGRFSATYIWSKVLILSIDAFKKLKPDGFNLSETYLEFLLKNRDKVPVNCGKIYKELTMIEMSHLRNLERSAELTLEAFSVTSSIIDQAEMMERARKLSSRAKGISLLTKDKLKEILAEKEEEFLCLPKEEEIEVMKMDREGCWGKSLWQLNMEDEEKGYGNVEDVALSHYSDVGYPKGIHCEGSLPVTLFACLFWQEIYELPVPGAFVSQFQPAPLDLFGSNFYDNRRDNFSQKFAHLEALEDFNQVWDTMTETYREFSSLESIICRVVEDAESFHEIIKCLGKNGVLGICKRIILGGYVNWRSGFPDLFVWNEKTGKCKVIEVKGPGDTLSVKQKLWIKYLEEIGVKVEVCLVKAKQKC